MRKDYVNRESLYLCLCASVRVRQYFVWRLHCITLSFVRLHVCLVNTKWSDKDEIVVLERRRRRREKKRRREKHKKQQRCRLHIHTQKLQMIVLSMRRAKLWWYVMAQIVFLLLLLLTAIESRKCIDDSEFNSCNIIHKR